MLPVASIAAVRRACMSSVWRPALAGTVQSIHPQRCATAPAGVPVAQYSYAPCLCSASGKPGDAGSGAGAASHAGHHHHDHKHAPTAGAPAASGSAPPAAANTTAVPGAQHGGDKFIMLYTCTVCDTRSARTVSKQAYAEGVVIVRCPGCSSLHLVADRLGYFDDGSVDVEAILAAKGQTVRNAAAARRAPADADGAPRVVAAGAGGSAAGEPVGVGEATTGGGAARGTGDENVIELDARDVQVLRSRTKSVRLADGQEVAEELGADGRPQRKSRAPSS
jgi:hypothetical protein